MNEIEPQARFADGINELVGWLGSQRAEDRAAEAVERLTQYGLAA